MSYRIRLRTETKFMAEALESCIERRDRMQLLLEAYKYPLIYFSSGLVRDALSSVLRLSNCFWSKPL